MELKLPSGRTVGAADVADALGLPAPALVEKDFHVVRVLRALSTVQDENFRLVFAGGTCLARAHRATQRMSEDIDIKVVPVEGKTNTRGTARALREAVLAGLAAEGFIITPPNVSNEGRNVEVVLDYPQTTPSIAALRPQILLELTHCKIRTETTKLPIRSFVAEAAREAAEIAGFDCCSITETAAEKIVALTRRIANDLESQRKEFDPTLIRHLYDLSVLQHRINYALVSAMAAEIAIMDADQFANQYPGYKADPKARTLEAMKALGTEQRFQTQYSDFIGAMVYGPRPTFEEALEVSKILVNGMWP